MNQSKFESTQPLTTCSDIASAQRLVTFSTDKVEPTEVVPFTQRRLSTIWAFDGKELGSHDIVAILNHTQGQLGMTVKGAEPGIYPLCI